MSAGPAWPKQSPPKKPDSLFIERLDNVGVWLLRPPTWRGTGWGVAQKTAGSGAPGTTFVELMAAAAIMMILAGTILPLARVTVKRQRESELRRALREMRRAIDEYKTRVDQGQIGGSDVKLGSEGYPPDLETLVKGVSQVGRLDRKLKFLRRIPIDPMTRFSEWGRRCYQDEPDSRHWCGDNVYDVYTTSDGTALDGTKYKDW